MDNEDIQDELNNIEDATDKVKKAKDETDLLRDIKNDYKTMALLFFTIIIGLLFTVGFMAVMFINHIERIQEENLSFFREVEFSTTHIQESFIEYAELSEIDFNVKQKMAD